MYEPRTKSSRLVIEALSLGATLLLLMALVYWAMSVNSSLPVVKKSNSTQQCVEVLSKDNKYTCDNLPDKYSLVWVK